MFLFHLFRHGHFVEYTNMHAMNMWLTDATTVVVGGGGGLDFAPWRHNNVGVVTTARHDTTQVMLGLSLWPRWDTTLVHTS